MTPFVTHITRLPLLGALLLIGGGAAFSDSFMVSSMSPGVQTPVGITTNYESFDSQTSGTTLSSPLVTNFGGSSYTGTYTGSISWEAANLFGGAGGTGIYPMVSNGSYSLALNAGVNYFGLWLSALDSGNQLDFYNGSSLVYSFTPAELTSLIGSCPGGSFCGNPNPGFAGDDAAEGFAYLNIFDTTGTFNQVVFTEVGAGGFESDNQAVAMLTPDPAAIPEPANAALVGAAGLLALGCFTFRQRTNS